LGPNIYGLVVDFGIIFNQKSLQALDGRLINSHFSRLPEWRGADPITYSLLSGQKQTAVSLIRVAPELDSGEILAQSAVTIEAADNSHSLSRKLLKTSNDLINRTLDGWMAGQTTLRKQPPGPITYSRQINKSDGQLDFQKPAAVLERQIRAFSDWPGSHCTIGQLEVLVTKAEAVQETLALRQIVIEQKNLLIGCRVGSLKILQLKPVNRQNMTVAGFLNGYQAKLKDNLIAG
jgi:methionyl-tRNA formyltransferase